MKPFTSRPPHRFLVAALAAALAACGGGDPEPEPSAEASDGSRAQALAGGGGIGDGGGSGGGGGLVCQSPSRTDVVSTLSGVQWTRAALCHDWKLHEIQFTGLPAYVETVGVSHGSVIETSHLSPSVAQARCSAHRYEYRIERRVTTSFGSFWSVLSSGERAGYFSQYGSQSWCGITSNGSGVTWNGSPVSMRVWVRTQRFEGATEQLTTGGYTYP